MPTGRKNVKNTHTLLDVAVLFLLFVFFYSILSASSSGRHDTFGGGVRFVSFVFSLPWNVYVVPVVFSTMKWRFMVYLLLPA